MRDTNRRISSANSRINALSISRDAPANVEGSSRASRVSTGKRVRDEDEESLRSSELTASRNVVNRNLPSAGKRLKNTRPVKLINIAVYE